MKLLTEYFELEKRIHEYFGYKEDWRSIPLCDCTSQHWILKQDENGRGEVRYFDEEFTKEIIEDQAYYSAQIYTQRFLPKWVYRGGEYTMVCADTQVDGNKFLMIFNNALECTDEALTKLL